MSGTTSSWRLGRPAQGWCLRPQPEVPRRRCSEGWSAWLGWPPPSLAGGTTRGVARGWWPPCSAAVWADNPNRPHPLGEWAAPLAVVSIVGVWTSVPDTEPALAAGAVLAPLALALAAARRPVGPAGTAALVVAILGPIWVGSAGWGAALATVSAIGVVAAAPVVGGFRRASLSAAQWSAVITTQVVIAVPLSRVIMRRSVPVAVVLSVLGLAAALLVMSLVLTPGQRSQAGAVKPPN